MPKTLEEIAVILASLEARVKELEAQSGSKKSKKSETSDIETIAVSSPSEVPKGYLTSRQWLESKGLTYTYVAAGQCGQRAARKAKRLGLKRYGVKEVNEKGVEYLKAYWPVEAYEENAP